MLTTLPPPCAVVIKSGNLNFLEPSGPLQPCKGTDLPSPLRRILNIHWPKVISNEELWRRAEEIDMSTQIKRRKWNWIGRTLRKGHEAIEREALEWNPQEKMRRGRHRHT